MGKGIPWRYRSKMDKLNRQEDFSYEKLDTNMNVLSDKIVACVCGSTENVELFVKDTDKKKHTNYYLHEYFTYDEMVRALDEMLR